MPANTTSQKLSKISPSDLVLGIVVFSGIEKMKDSKRGFQNAFYQLKQKYPDEFKRFVFSPRYDDYYSDMIYEMHAELVFAGILQQINPSYDELKVLSIPENDSSSSFSSYLDKLFTATQRRRIQEIASEFKSLMDFYITT